MFICLCIISLVFPARLTAHHLTNWKFDNLKQTEESQTKSPQNPRKWKWKRWPIDKRFSQWVWCCREEVLFSSEMQKGGVEFGDFLLRIAEREIWSFVSLAQLFATTCDIIHSAGEALVLFLIMRNRVKIGNNFKLRKHQFRPYLINHL